MPKYSIARFKCPFCPTDSSVDYAHEKKFMSHVVEVHGKSDVSSEQLYIDAILQGEVPLCKCGCGAKVKFYGWKKGFPTPYLRGHNAVEQGNFSNPDKIAKLVEKRTEGYRSGRTTVWNKGKKIKKEPSTIIVDDSNKLSVIESLIETPQHKTVHEEIQHGTLIKRLYLREQEGFDVSSYQAAYERDIKEIADYISSLGFPAQTCVSDIVPGHVLDVWVPSAKFTVDYCNFYLRCEPILKNKKFFEQKYDACVKEEIGIFMMYEDEWRDKQDLIKSMIRHRLGLSKNVYHSRKLDVKKLETKDRQRFFDMSHLEEDANSHIAFGLVTPDGEIVAAMSLRRAFHDQYKEYYEVGRSACKPDCVVHGWIGKLTKVCLEYAIGAGKRGLVTYVDSRVGLGKAYVEAGFVLAKDSTGARLWWTDFVNKFNRFQYKADLPNGKSQAQVCEEAGVVALFGMGNKLLKLEKK